MDNLYLHNVEIAPAVDLIWILNSPSLAKILLQVRVVVDEIMANNLLLQYIPSALATELETAARETKEKHLSQPVPYRSCSRRHSQKPGLPLVVRGLIDQICATCILRAVT
jgi:hypothetical protein